MNLRQYGMHSGIVAVNGSLSLHSAAAQVQGLCMGTLAGTSAHAAAFVWLWLKTDWQAEAHKAALRADVKMEMRSLTRAEATQL